MCLSFESKSCYLIEYARSNNGQERLPKHPKGAPPTTVTRFKIEPQEPCVPKLSLWKYRVDAGIQYQVPICPTAQGLTNQLKEYDHFKRA